MTRTTEYRAWHNAKVRCYWTKGQSYPYYGGRGIGMCEKWRNDFAAFYADMGDCPKGHTLERIDVNGDYEPSNCKWIPHKEQTHNKRNTLKCNGITLKQIAADRGISYYTLRLAMQRGENPMTFIPRGH